MKYLFVILLFIFPLMAFCQDEKLISSLKKELNFNDDIRIIYKQSANSDHVIAFLDSSKNTKYHNVLKKWFLSCYTDKDLYESVYHNQENLSGKLSSDLKVPINLKKVFVPIYLYKKKFYTRYSCDFQVSYSINDSSLVECQMDGAYPSIIKQINAIGSQKFEIITSNRNAIIELNDIKKPIYKIKTDYYCGYLIPIEKIDDYPIIVCNSPNGEFDETEILELFDKYDCEK